MDQQLGHVHHHAHSLDITLIHRMHAFCGGLTYNEAHQKH